MRKLTPKTIFILFATYSIIYSVILIVNFFLIYNIETYSDYFKFKLSSYLSLINGIGLLIGGIAFLFTKEWGRFTCIILLIMAFIVHGFQISFLLDQIEVIEFKKLSLDNPLSIYFPQFLLNDAILNLKLLKNYFNFYLITAVIFIIANTFAIYFIGRPSMQDYIFASKFSLDNYLAHYSHDINDSQFMREKKNIKLISFFLLATGICTMILYITYWLMFPANHTFWILLLSLFTSSMFIGIALFISETKVQIIPFAISFFIILFIYIIYKIIHITNSISYKIFTLPYQKIHWGMMFFALLDILYLILCVVTVCIGIYMIVAKNNLLSLFYIEKNKSKQLKFNKLF